MENPKIRIIALIVVNLAVLWLAKQWVLGNPDSLEALLKGLPS